MFREIITPKTQDYTIHIPDEYLNSPVEILVLPLNNKQSSLADDSDDIFKKTAGLLKDRVIDPLEWQKTLERNEMRADHLNSSSTTAQGDKMAGKFMRGIAMYDTRKDEERTNARLKRLGTLYHVRVTSCGCPDVNCGAFHVIETNRPLPTEAEAIAKLKRNSQEHKARKRKTEST